jgi:uncharacterized protein YoxC
VSVSVSLGEIAGLIAAGAFLLLVGVLAVPILKLRRTVDAATRALNQMTDQAGPLLASVHTSVDGVNQTITEVNGQLVKVDTITDHVQQVTTNVSALTSLFAATLGSPLVKVAAFTYGVRRAAAARRHADVEREVRATMKSQRRTRRRKEF